MNELTAKIEQDLKLILNTSFSEDIDKDKKYKEIYEYALLPAGKLFRSQLLWCVFGDLTNNLIQKAQTLVSPNHQLLSAAIEIHHSYTLIHDDMPCMDNDDYRRGKLSTHKKYGEWKALLIGDGLLNMSYQILSQIQHPKINELLKLFSQSCGHLGLVYGQYLDLNVSSSPSSFKNIRKIHQLKTGKLFECAIMGSYLLSDKDELETKQKLKIISSSIGELFQFLDDLTELSEIDLETHEVEVNPWLSFYDETIKETLLLLKKTNSNLESFDQTRLTIKKYFEKIRLYLLSNKTQVLRFIKKEDLNPLILALE
jgi:geranylgeranyl pyrophosphate synthase